MKYRSTIKHNSHELKFGTIVTPLLLAFFSVFLTWNPSYAGTVKSISGNISNGQTITIKGSGFGSAGPKVVLFDDFESGTAGANIKTGTGSAKFGQWESRAGSSFYGTTAKVSGTKSFTSDFSKSYGNAITARLPAGTNSVFASWWLFVPSGKNFPGEGTTNGANWKQMWLLGKDTVNDDFVLPTRFATNWAITGNDKVSGKLTTWTQVNMKKGSWKRIWAWVKGSSSSTSLNGEIKFWELNGGVVQRVNKTGITTLKTGGSFQRLKPNAYGRQTPNCVTSFDDIYIATGPNAQARIEVGNASTYAKSTKLTILTPKSWSDGSISAQVNTGQFKTGEAAYLFVFKADGSVSSGYPIKMGATASGSSSTVVQPPPAPNLQLK
jgi:hypothetical protein